jgi:hypothetical protein
MVLVLPISSMSGLQKSEFLPGDVPHRTMLIDLRNLKCSIYKATFLYAPVIPRISGLPLFSLSAVPAQ